MDSAADSKGSTASAALVSALHPESLAPGAADPVFTTYAAPISRSRYLVDEGWHLRFYDRAKHGILTTPAFEGDLIESALSMSLKPQPVLFFFNCGITDRFGVSVVVPIPNVDVEATNTSSGPPRL